ncbi:phage terminase small subunit P27 family [Nitratireductor mangrovi]|uniref:Phage terminase small subunit P27 family n=1 Tax=Nitratireductor mangrovi TaxID=2599600 RepID=A0A6H0DXA3_9HYPH|nr:phage terminase small subunit P27 family [Nitratireductor mangrovi]QIS94686.1 phage terminase small subunit P27 family [Nitratireductor mangrovi]
MRGRKPLPTAMKIVLGNPGKRPLNHLEPKPVTAMPTCPAHLSPTAKAEWKRLGRYLHRLGIMSDLDRAAFAAYCQAYGRWVEAEKRLKETPTLLKTPAGYVQPSPWLAIANKNVELMHKFMCELGLSPSSRSRVTTSSPLGPKPWEFSGLEAEDDEFFS